jgi:hypothetical protein
LDQYSKTAVGKPDRPKEAMEEALRRSRTPRSSSLYAELARKVGVQRCVDSAFQQFRDMLCRWFGTIRVTQPRCLQSHDDLAEIKVR